MFQVYLSTQTGSMGEKLASVKRNNTKLPAAVVGSDVAAMQ